MTYKLGFHFMIEEIYLARYVHEHYFYSTADEFVMLCFSMKASIMS